MVTQKTEYDIAEGNGLGKGGGG